MRFYKKQRRPFLLLEILIAFGLVALCIFPLVFSQFKILAAQKELHARLEGQRLANEQFTRIVESLYKGELTLEQLPHEMVREKESGSIIKISFNQFAYYLFIATKEAKYSNL